MNRPALVLVLVFCGAAWGLTQPLTKIAVGGGHQPFGLVFWQAVIGAVVLGFICLLRGRAPPFGPDHLRLYLVIALVGTVLPNGVSYAAAARLPSGIMSISIATVPMFAFPIALAMGIDKFSAPRFAGLLLGLFGIVLIAAPEAGLPDPAMAAWLPLALVAPAFYGLEGNYVAKFGTAGLDPVRVLTGASICAAAISLPVALLTGQFVDPTPPWGRSEAALTASSVIHAAVYATYVWLVGRSGSVFASQVSYLVTGFGVAWAILILAETYSSWVWLALLSMFAGLALVQPRPPARRNGR